MEDIKVTVYLSTYNQEKYLREAIDSILMQKCSFNYELLIADDCSTDGTQAIALEYQKKYPDIITTYFTPENVGGCKKLTNCIDMGLFRGDYLAYLEGDDYWLGEDRLQTLVDFLEENPQYSRVSHKRKVIDEYGNDKGFDISDEVLNSKFTIKDFLDGKNYSDFGSVFRNYYKEARDKYHSLLQASRNVCDFQDMFITQDFGPVYVMDKCFGVYRSRSVAGESNYNSVVKKEARRVDKVNIARAVEKFYGGKYDLTPRIRQEQRKLLMQAIALEDDRLMEVFRSITEDDAAVELFAEAKYLAWRKKNDEEKAFIEKHISKIEAEKLPQAVRKYTAERIRRKIKHLSIEDKRRGYLNPEFGE